MNDRVRWMTANGYKWGNIIKMNNRYVLVETDEGKNVILLKAYLKKHNDLDK